MSKLVVFQTAEGKWKFRLVENKRNVVLTGTDEHATPQAALAQANKFVVYDEAVKSSVTEEPINNPAPGSRLP